MDPFSFADAPSIVRAHQKDSYFEQTLRGHLLDVIQIFAGQRFLHTHPEELTIAAKALYLAATTLVGTRTLGEEYVDLVYVTRTGRALPAALSKLGFIASYTVVPYVLARLLKRANAEETDETQSWFRRLLGRVFQSRVVDTVMHIHVALFYFSGNYYQLLKRLFGLRYIFGHKVDKERLARGGYELLGALVFAQLMLKAMAAIPKMGTTKPVVETKRHPGRVYGIKKDEGAVLDLLDPSVLPYIPEVSRKCMLCLSYMTLPACAPCGHVFCWTCIGDWCRERPECPLCRQGMLEQSLLVLR